MVLAPSGADARWRVNPLVQLHWRILDEEWVGFEAVSGESTVMDALEAAVMACFEEGPRSRSQLVDALSADLAVDPTLGLSARVDTAVQECLARGWLEPLESGR